MPARKTANLSKTTATKKTVSKSSSSPRVVARQSQMLSSAGGRKSKTKETMSRIDSGRSEMSPSSNIIESIRSRSKYLVIGLGAIAIIGILYYYRGFFVVATVNGEPISRIAYYQELEKQGGQQALNTIIIRTLVLQEAKKNNVTVSSEEIDKEIKAIEDRLKSQGQQLDQLLAFQGLTRDGFKEQIRLQKLAEKMAAADVKVTDKNIDDYIKNNPSATGNASSDSERKQVETQLKQQKVSELIEKWLENLKSKAKIDRFIT